MNWQNLTDQQKLDIAIDLRAKLAGCERDAARYRLLRQISKTDFQVWRIGFYSPDKWVHGAELDKALDAAMKEST